MPPKIIKINLPDKGTLYYNIIYSIGKLKVLEVRWESLNNNQANVGLSFNQTRFRGGIFILLFHILCFIFFYVIFS